MHCYRMMDKDGDVLAGRDFDPKTLTYHVGYYAPNGDWIDLEQHAALGPARDSVNYLNGGREVQHLDPILEKNIKL